MRSTKPEGRGGAGHVARTLSLYGLAYVALRLLPQRPDTSTRTDRREPGTDRVGARRDGADRCPPETSAGRSSDTPAEIPARGWFEVGKRVYASLSQDRLMAVAAGVTFYALLAVFPAITAIVSIFGLVADPATLSDQIASLGNLMPGGAVEIIGEQVKRIVSQKGALGFGFVIGLGTSLWSSNAGMKAVFDALNVAYGEPERRGFIRLNLVSLVFTIGAILFLLAAIGAVVVLPVVLNLVGFGGVGPVLVSVGRWPALVLVILMALALLYRFGPSRREPAWRWITPGSLVAALGWTVFSLAFSWYVSSFGSYNETYGSLGAAIGFMTWIWLSTAIVLVGAEVNAETERQAAA